MLSWIAENNCQWQTSREKHIWNAWVRLFRMYLEGLGWFWADRERFGLWTANIVQKRLFEGDNGDSGLIHTL